MKIMAFRIHPIARTFAVIYAIFGVLFWITYCLSKVETVTLPVGIVAPLLHLNFNFTFHRSTDLVYNLLLLLGSIASYALTGWLTAAVVVVCFNAAARWRDGIDADFISLREKQKLEPVLSQ